MQVMVFDVGGTEIKYSVMDEQLNRTHTGSVPTPQDTQEHFLDTLYALYAPHRNEVDGIAMAVPGFVNTQTGYLTNGGALLYNTDTPLGTRLREKCGCRAQRSCPARSAARPTKWAHYTPTCSSPDTQRGSLPWEAPSFVPQVLRKSVLR